MKSMYLAVGLAVATVSPVQACEVKTAAAYRDEAHGNQVIPVDVRRGERCVILDLADERGRETYRTLWRPVEKYGMVTANRYGRFLREYKVRGDVARVDRYVYRAGDTPGVEQVVFAAFPDGQERRAVAYLISVH